MKNTTKEDLLKQRLTVLKDCLEISRECINSAINNLENLDEFNDLVHNWDKYIDVFDKS